MRHHSTPPLPGTNDHPLERRQRSGRLILALGLAIGLFVGGGGVAVATHSFPDVASTNAFHSDIEWLADTGITGGYDDGTYRPGQAVTRGSMAAFLRRLAGQDASVEPVVDAATLGGLTATQLKRQTARWAVVGANGTFVRGTPGTTALQYDGFAGQYLVTFGANVSQCGYVGTIARLSDGLPVPGFVSVRSSDATPNAVFVITRNAAGTPTNLDFHLAALC